MTEKRLPIPKYYYGLDGNIRDEKYIYETKTMPKGDIDELFYDEKHLGSNSLMDLLNALYEENRKLKIEIETYKAGNKTIHERLKTLHEENQDLKTGTYINAKNTIKELKEENTHIKNTIQTMIKNERTAIGQSVLQQLWEAIQ